jgi:Na+/H+ antiporter NhaA
VTSPSAEPAEAGRYTGRTAWTRTVRTPLRRFVATESGGASVMVAATVAALVWVNIDAGSYDRVWHTTLTVQLGSHGISQSVRAWIDNGAMTLFFFVVGLEARREADLGELRERRRAALPLLAGLAGMLVPVLIYLAINAGAHSAHGWGMAMSTDTAFALGMLTLVGPRFPDRLRSFLLTVVVVDDIAALVVIATAYPDDLAVRPLLLAVLFFAAVVGVRALRVHSGLAYLALGIATWVAMRESGVDPVVVGLAMGLLTYAYPAARADLERATQQFRLFREQPTPELARRARASIEGALSPNDRLAQIWHPWTSYLIVPVFALANAGVSLRPGFLADAFTSRITLGVLLGYVVGKPVGLAGLAWVVTKASRGRLRPPVGWGSVIGAGSVAGIGFTVSLLIASLAFTGIDLEKAKLGILAAALGAGLLSYAVFRSIERLPTPLRARALLGTSSVIEDLADPVDPERDHIRGPRDALVTVVEYGDLECPDCGQAEPVVRELLADFTDITYVWRHLPLDDVHPHARLAAEATEAAAAQGKFWEMHDRLLSAQDALRVRDLVGHARDLGLDVDRFQAELDGRVHSSRVQGDVDGADLSGVSGTPTFFINGHRHQGAYDIATLKGAVKAAGARALISERDS